MTDRRIYDFTINFLSSAFTAALLAAVPDPPAHAQIPVTDAAANTSLAASVIQGVKAAADRAADYAQQVATYVELVNTYATAVQNTVAIPMDASYCVINAF